jgi:predicted nucleic acid-binding protein
LRPVIDASAALPWFFADEKSDESDRILTTVYRDGAVVPMLWHIEVGNALTVGLRRKRLSEPDWLKSIATLAGLPVTPDPIDPSRVLSELATLAQKHNLRFYDALYLELALRLAIPLASFDADLVKAARALNVPIWDSTST